MCFYKLPFHAYNKNAVEAAPVCHSDEGGIPRQSVPARIYHSGLDPESHNTYCFLLHRKKQFPDQVRDDRVLSLPFVIPMQEESHVNLYLPTFVIPGLTRNRTIRIAFCYAEKSSSRIKSGMTVFHRSRLSFRTMWDASCVCRTRLSFRRRRNPTSTCARPHLSFRA
jgi:hypothetical protein